MTNIKLPSIKFWMFLLPPVISVSFVLTLMINQNLKHIDKKMI